MVAPVPSAAAEPGGLVGHLDGFVRAVREAGVPVGISQAVDAAEILTVVDLLDREQLRHGLAAVLLQRAAQRPAYDAVVQGMSGIMAITGPAGGSATKPGAPVADLSAGLHAFGGICAALLGRTRTGRGTHLDVAMLDATGARALGEIITQLADRHVVVLLKGASVEHARLLTAVGTLTPALAQGHVFADLPAAIAHAAAHVRTGQCPNAAAGPPPGPPPHRPPATDPLGPPAAVRPGARYFPVRVRRPHSRNHREHGRDQYS